MNENVIDLIRQAAREVAEKQKPKKINGNKNLLVFPLLFKINNKIREFKLCLQ